MDVIAAFFERNIVVIYFIYGLAFFCMGLVVWLESRRTSEFRIARAIGPLAGFGIIHGLHEWFEMFQRLGQANATNIPDWLLLDQIRIPHLVLSFVLLIVFGVRLIYLNRREDGNEQAFAYLSAGALVAVWLASVFVTRWLYNPDQAQLVAAVDVLSRYMLGIPGAVLAAWAIVLEQRSFRARGMSGFGRDLLWAAWALVLYGIVGQTFPQQSFLFPSNIINANLFLELFGIPIQFFRASEAVVMAVFVIRALRAFDLERQQRLAAANEASLAAQREALTVQQQAQAETEQLNLELQAAVQDLTLLFELSGHLAAILDRDTLLQQAIAKIVGSMPRLEAGMILLHDEAGKPLQCMASVGYKDGPEGQKADSAWRRQAHKVGQRVVEMGQPVCGPVDGKLIPLGDATSLRNGRIPDHFEPERGGTLGVPLTLQEQVAGSLVLTVHRDGPPLSARDLSLISTVAGQLSMAIENATLYREVQARQALRGELLHRVVSAQERERRRIARELHDGAGQILTGLGLGLAAAGESVSSNPDLAAKHLAELKRLNAQALQELRDIIGDLRPSLLDDLGLVPALHGQAKEFESRTGVKAEFKVNGSRRRVQPEIETIVFRITQEALTNVAKHAAAESVAICLTFNQESLQLTVQDDGCGFELDEALKPGAGRRRAWGLLGMQERVTLVGGTYRIISQPGEGTTIQATVPLTGERVTNVQD